MWTRCWCGLFSGTPTSKLPGAGPIEKAQAMKRDLLAKIDSLGQCLPNNVLDELIDRLGGPSKVAEVCIPLTGPLLIICGPVDWSQRSDCVHWWRWGPIRKKIRKSCSGWYDQFDWKRSLLLRYRASVTSSTRFTAFYERREEYCDYKRSSKLWNFTSCWPPIVQSETTSSYHAWVAMECW